MKSLPIEIWEAILDEVHWLPSFAGSPIPTRVFHLQQRTLNACARVCRAWSPHACFLLWHDVLLDTPPSVAAFIASVRDAPDRWTPVVSSLFLHSDVGDCTTELFMQPFPNLRVLSANAVNWNYVHPQLFRMRLPFFASLAELQLDKCIFPSLRILFDLVWVSSNLVHLVLQDCRVFKEITNVASSHNLERACRNVQGCSKLTSLFIYGYPFVAGTPLLGNAFSTAVTTLDITYVYFTDALSLPSFLRGSFPALRELHVAADEANMKRPSPQTSTATPEPPFLHALADP